MAAVRKFHVVRCPLPVGPCPSPMPYARVLIDRAIRRELDYAIPENLADRVNIGWRVRVPFRDHSALATVVALVEETAATNVRHSSRGAASSRCLSVSLVFQCCAWIALPFSSFSGL